MSPWSTRPTIPATGRARCDGASLRHLAQQMLKRNAQGYGILPRRAQLELLALQVAIDRRQIDSNSGRNSVHSESIAFDMGFDWVHSEPILWDFSVHVNIFCISVKNYCIYAKPLVECVSPTAGTGPAPQWVWLSGGTPQRPAVGSKLSDNQIKQAAVQTSPDQHEPDMRAL